MQANTVPAAFWALAFLLLPEHQHYKQQVLASCQQFHSQSDQATTATAGNLLQYSATDGPSVQSSHVPSKPAEHGITDRPSARSSALPAQHGTRDVPSMGQRASDMPSTQSSGLSTQQGLLSEGCSGQNGHGQFGLVQQSSSAVTSAQARHSASVPAQQPGGASSSTQPRQDPAAHDQSSLSGKRQSAAGSSRHDVTTELVSGTSASLD